MTRKMLVFQTDFGYKDSTVAAMYGVVKTVDPDIELIDSTHELPVFDVWAASYRLWQCMRFWPKGTVFVSVVDPGVGTQRKACAALTTDGYYIITPDNGTLTHIAKYHGIREVREIDETVNRLHHAGTDHVSVFHGRDLFGYCAARLAAGIISFEETGNVYPVSDIVAFPMPDPVYGDAQAEGYIEIDDSNFGNLFTNMKTEALLNNGFSYGKFIDVDIYDADKLVFHNQMLFDVTFGMVKKGSPVAYNNELMNLSFAVCEGNFRDSYHIGSGEKWKVKIKAL